MLVNILLLLFFISLSAFFSGSETAFISARKIKFLVWIKQGKKGAKRAHDFLLKPERFLSTTLVGNNIAVVAASMIFALILKDLVGNVYITLITTLILLVFGEVIPKYVGSQIANQFTLHTFAIHLFFHKLLYPLIRFVEELSLMILKVFKFQEDDLPVFSRRDLEILVHEGERTGIINKDEREKISRMVVKGRRSVQEVMIPRTEIAAIDRTQSVADASSLFRKSGFSRLPVMDGSLDQITGLVYAPDIICKRPETLEQVRREILFIPQSLNMLSLLHTMKFKGKTMAIAVDEFGGTAGLITIEDMLEEFFGEIEDEYDCDVNHINRIGLNRLDVKARIEIDELNENFNLGLPTGDYRTLGGLIINKLGRIPHKGEKVKLGGLILIVLAAQKDKVSRVRILLPLEEEK